MILRKSLLLTVRKRFTRIGGDDPKIESEVTSLRKFYPHRRG